MKFNDLSPKDQQDVLRMAWYELFNSEPTKKKSDLKRKLEWIMGTMETESAK